MMEEQIERLHKIIDEVSNLLNNLSDEDLRSKPAPGKWSKIEILGHLIDSGINNLQRFTEVQFKPKPYEYSNYQQDDLVIANKYQDADLLELLGFYHAINQRIIEIMNDQTKTTLAFQVYNMSTEKSADLQFLMTDYVDHMDHHLKQILR